MTISTGRLEGETDWDLDYSYKAAGPNLVEVNINDFPRCSTHKGMSIGEVKVSVVFSQRVYVL